MRIKQKINKFVNKYIFFRTLKLIWFKNKWRRNNTHNFTTAGNAFDIKKVTVGNKTYGEITVKHFGNDAERLSIGHYCSIGPKVCFVLGGEHTLNSLSTYPFKVKLLDGKNESICKGPIVVESDVWLGYGVTILSGTHIGQGAVVAAGAVVATDVPPYAVVGGIPARVIKYRFEKEIIDKLLRIDYGRLTNVDIKNNLDFLYRELTDIKQLDDMENILPWLEE